jgi:hypothetical protein
MAKDVPALTYNSALAIAEYIFQRPGQTKSQILEGLSGSVSELDFNIAEDFLGDNAIIYGQWRRTTLKGNNVWERVYMPEKEKSLDSVINYLKNRLLILPDQVNNKPA